MSNVIDINSARSSEPNIEADSTVSSPVEALLIRFEPLIESVKAHPESNHQAELLEFKALLENSKVDIEELEQMTNFLLALNSTR